MSIIDPVNLSNNLLQITVNSGNIDKVTRNFQQVLDNAVKSKDNEKLKQLCQDFEAIMVSMVIKSMRQAIPKDGLIPDSFEQGVFQSMLDDEYARLMVQKQNFGIAQQLYNQLTSRT